MSEKCNDSQRRRFFPRADAAVLQSKYSPPSPTSRPSTTAPIFDVEHADKPLDAWAQYVAGCVYPENADPWAPALIPQRPEHVVSSYLFPILTRNERLRLTMLSYYTRGLFEDSELISRLQEKVHLAKDTIEWEFVIAGLLDHNTYTRIVTVGLPLAVLPRRESTCAHTVNQPPGTVFTVLNMAEDWRFQSSPHVEIGGLRAYAGVPLRFETEFGEHVCFGSLCVASNSNEAPLSRGQQTALIRLADWIVTDIVHSARARRQRERRKMQELLNNANELCQQAENVEEIVLDVLKQIYPEAKISLQKSDDRRLVTLDERDDVPYSDFDNGLWEDVDCFDEMIRDSNHGSMVSTHPVRVIAAECDHAVQPTYLVIASKDFRLVFDDVDFWLVNSCAALLSRFWQRRALKEALTIKENFLRGIAHQLRTPIHGILGSAELLAEDLKARDIIDAPSGTDSQSGFSDADMPSLYSYISSIRNSARELIGTVNSIIKINQWTDAARSHHVHLLHHIGELETTLLNEMISIIPDDYHRRPSIILSRRLPSDCDSLVLDLKLTIDCLSPLVINAIQSTVGGGVVAVTMSLSEDYQTLIVDVEDTGCGIALHNQKHIFDAHRKLDEHSTRAGLGLTLASRLATLMDGSVALISSIEGKGSHFRASFHVTSACSRKPPQSSSERYKYLPSTFHKVPSTAPSSPLDRHICSFLNDLGIFQSEDSSTPLVIVNYSADIDEFRKGLPHISPNQVAVCLIPDFAESHIMSEERVQSENNIVFVKGPFLPRVLEEAFNQANLIFANYNSENGDHVSEQLEKVCAQLENTTITKSTITTSAVEPLPIDPIKESTVSTIQDILIDTISSAPTTPPLTRTRTTKPMALLVDDNAVNLRLLQMYCKRRKIPHCTATDGEKAVVTFLKHQSAASRPAGTEPIEFILMDLQMPVCDGLDATRQIRALEKEHGWTPSVISIVTGQDSPSDRLGAIEAGAQGFLTKPVGPKVLDTKVKQWFPGLDLEDGV